MIYKITIFRYVLYYPDLTVAQERQTESQKYYHVTMMCRCTLPRTCLRVRVARSGVRGDGVLCSAVCVGGTRRNVKVFFFSVIPKMYHNSI